MSHAHTAGLLRRRRRLMTGAAGVGVAAALLAGGPAVSAASAATPAAAAAATTSAVKFTFTQPPSTLVDVAFTGGLTDITQQNAIANMQGFNASGTGFWVESLGSPNGADTDTITGLTTPGTPISGSVMLPSGATMTAQVNGGSPVTLTGGAFSIPVASMLGAGHTVTPSVVVSPKAVRPGDKVRISGVAPAGSRTGAELTLLSSAFPRAHKVAGFPAITTRVSASGTYATTVQIPATTKPNTYGVTGRVGKRYLPVAALRVRR